MHSLIRRATFRLLLKTIRGNSPSLLQMPTTALSYGRLATMHGMVCIAWFIDAKYLCKPLVCAKFDKYELSIPNYTMHKVRRPKHAPRLQRLLHRRVRADVQPLWDGAICTVANQGNGVSGANSRPCRRRQLPLPCCGGWKQGRGPEGCWSRSSSCKVSGSIVRCGFESFCRFIFKNRFFWCMFIVDYHIALIASRNWLLTSSSYFVVAVLFCSVSYYSPGFTEKRFLCAAHARASMALGQGRSHFLCKSTERMVCWRWRLSRLRLIHSTSWIRAKNCRSLCNVLKLQVHRHCLQETYQLCTAIRYQITNSLMHSFSAI